MTSAWTAGQDRLKAVVRTRGSEILCVVGLAACALPTLYRLARQSWISEQGEQGPIVLAIGIWLLARSWRQMQAEARSGSAPIMWCGMALGAALYALGRISGEIIVESFALYLLLVVSIYGLMGARAMSRNWFPILYLVFSLPIPFFITGEMSRVLRQLISVTVVEMLQFFDMSVVRDGLTIIIDQYVIEMKDACSGMNSLFSLSAICLFYIYIRRQPRWTYYVLMALPIVIFAILANFVRVVTLVLMTHFLGDAVAQGPLHETAGFITFLVALVGIVVADRIAAPLASPKKVNA
jgi:exosortase